MNNKTFSLLLACKREQHCGSFPGAELRGAQWWLCMQGTCRRKVITLCNPNPEPRTVGTSWFIININIGKNFCCPLIQKTVDRPTVTRSPWKHLINTKKKKTAVYSTHCHSYCMWATDLACVQQGLRSSQDHTNWRLTHWFVQHEDDECWTWWAGLYDYIFPMAWQTRTN